MGIALIGLQVCKISGCNRYKHSIAAAGHFNKWDAETKQSNPTRSTAGFCRCCSFVLLGRALQLPRTQDKQDPNYSYSFSAAWNGASQTQRLGSLPISGPTSLSGAIYDHFMKFVPLLSRLDDLMEARLRIRGGH